jgi:hypothetical protein
MLTKYGIVIVLVVVVLGWGVINNGSQTTAQEIQRQFVGVDTCKMCHNGKMAEKGVKTPSYDVWKNESHSKAYENLASDKAKAVAKEKGLGDPQKAAECLKCHVTGYGVDANLLGKKYKMKDGVGCESCHGAGGDYAKDIKAKQAIKAGQKEPGSVGLIVKPDEKLCRQCHNEQSPTFKDFNFEERVKQIAHPVQ